MIGAPKPIDEGELNAQVREGMAVGQLLDGLNVYFDQAEAIVLQELGRVKPGDKSGLYHLSCRLWGVRDARSLMQTLVRRGEVARKKISFYHRAVEAWEKMRARRAA